MNGSCIDLQQQRPGLAMVLMSATLTPTAVHRDEIDSLVVLCVSEACRADAPALVVCMALDD